MQPRFRTWLLSTFEESRVVSPTIPGKGLASTRTRSGHSSSLMRSLVSRQWELSALIGQAGSCACLGAGDRDSPGNLCGLSTISARAAVKTPTLTTGRPPMCSARGALGRGSTRSPFPSCPVPVLCVGEGEERRDRTAPFPVITRAGLGRASLIRVRRACRALPDCACAGPVLQADSHPSSAPGGRLSQGSVQCAVRAKWELSPSPGGVEG